MQIRIDAYGYGAELHYHPLDDNIFDILEGQIQRLELHRMWQKIYRQQMSYGEFEKAIYVETKSLDDRLAEYGYKFFQNEDWYSNSEKSYYGLTKIENLTIEMEHDKQRVLIDCDNKIITDYEDKRIDAIHSEIYDNGMLAYSNERGKIYGGYLDGVEIDTRLYESLPKKTCKVEAIWNTHYMGNFFMSFLHSVAITDGGVYNKDMPLILPIMKANNLTDDYSSQHKGYYLRIRDMNGNDFDAF